LPEAQDLVEHRRLGGVWRHPDFGKLWLAGAVSMLGSEVSALAIPLTAILTLDVGPIGVGILAASGAAPALLFGLFAGVWVDRLRRRPVLIACDLARAALLASIPFVWASGLLSLAYLSVVAFLIGVFTVFFDVAHASYLPSLLRREELIEANSKLEISESLTQFVGPGGGGLLIQVLGAPLAIAADAVSFLISAVFLGRIQAQEPRTHADAESPGVLVEATQGLRFVASHPLLQAMVGYAATTQFFMSAALAVFLLYAVDELRLSPALIGLIFTAVAPGTIIGAVIASRAVRTLGFGSVLSIAAFLPGLGVLVMPLAAVASLSPVPLLMLAWFLLALGAIYDISELSLRQAVTPDQLRGRVNATRYFAFFGVIPIGALLGGALGATIGLRTTLVVAAIGLLFASLWIVFSPIRRLGPDPLRH
jgi:MFS family permease